MKQIQLTLTEGEADFLLAVLEYVGGHPRNSPRKYAERIRGALERATGITYGKTDAIRLIYGEGVDFADYPDPKGGSGQRRKPVAPPPYRPDEALIGYMEQGQREPTNVIVKIDGLIDSPAMARRIIQAIKRRSGNQSSSIGRA